MRLWPEDQEISLDSYSTRDLEFPHISSSKNYCVIQLLSLRIDINITSRLRIP